MTNEVEMKQVTWEDFEVAEEKVPEQPASFPITELDIYYSRQMCFPAPLCFPSRDPLTG